MFSGGFGGFGGFGGMSGQEDSEPQEKKQVNTTAFYELLGVEKTATSQQIRKAFRRKALKQHPDKGGDPQKFKTLSSAYDVLSNPQKRQLYDEYGQEGVQNGGPPGGSGFGDIFGNFFGGGKANKGPRKGKPRLVQVQVTLNEIYAGAMKKVKIERYRNCETCDGKGGQNVTKCVKCKGRGVVQKLVQLGPGMYTQSQQKCADCKGNGQIMKQEDRCKICKGEKVKKVQKQLEVAIESGVPDYHDYIFTGQSDQVPGIIAGDIYARVKIKQHKTFQRRGADLVIIKKISLLQALSGVTFEVEHLDGKKHIIATAPGEVLTNMELKTIKGLGLPFYKDPMSHGNLYIQFLVDFPTIKQLKGDPSKLTKILGMDIQKTQPKKGADRKILQQYDQSDLNQSEQGGHIKQQHHHGGNFGGQQVKCESQ